MQKYPEPPLWNLGFITYTKTHSQNTWGLSWAQSKTVSASAMDWAVWAGRWLCGYFLGWACLPQRHAVTKSWPDDLPGCPSSGEPATAPHGAGLAANQEAKGLTCELECSNKTRGHQPSQSTSSLLCLCSWQRLNGSDGKRRSLFFPTHLPFSSCLLHLRESTDTSPLHPSNKVLITPMGGDGRKDRKY